MSDGDGSNRRERGRKRERAGKKKKLILWDIETGTMKLTRERESGCGGTLQHGNGNTLGMKGRKQQKQRAATLTQSKWHNDDDHSPLHTSLSLSLFLHPPCQNRIANSLFTTWKHTRCFGVIKWNTFKKFNGFSENNGKLLFSTVNSSSLNVR